MQGAPNLVALGLRKIVVTVFTLPEDLMGEHFAHD